MIKGEIGCLADKTPKWGFGKEEESHLGEYLPISQIYLYLP